LLRRRKLIVCAKGTPEPKTAKKVRTTLVPNKQVGGRKEVMQVKPGQ
jgi:hypothetical protein